MSSNVYRVYPKEYLHLQIPVKKNHCFVIMPFRDELDKIYGELKDFLSRNGITCQRADEFKANPIIMDGILKGIMSSEYIITDITFLNANVFYELGIAHTLKNLENVIIIKQKNENYPFDLTHIRYIDYQKDNMYLLKSEIIDRIHQTKHKSNFADTIIVHGIIDDLSIDNDELINYLNVKLEEYLVDITEILNDTKYPDDRINKILTAFETMICELMADNSFSYISNVVKLYCKLVVATAYSEIAERHIKEFVLNRFTKSEHITWLTNLMIMLAEDKRLFRLSMDWIINYFRKSRASSIDLNRYSLEKFLMLSEDKDVDNIMIESLYSKDRFIREYMADIIGDKKLQEAVPTLFNRLDCEENNYVLRSYIHAISKIGEQDCLERLAVWIDKNSQKFIDRMDYFLFEHFYNAIKRLDRTKELIFVRDFEEKYGMYMNNSLV